MDYDLLVKKSSQIENGEIITFADGGLAQLGQTDSDTYYVLPDLKFTCSGNIIGFLLGVDVRISTTQYPEVLIAVEKSGMKYNFIHSRNISLDPIDFQPTGIYKYTLSNPLPFEEGQFIGIKQTMTDDSRVRFYYQTASKQKIQLVHEVSNNGGMYSKANGPNTHHWMGTLLLHPITSKVTIKRL